jgi:hypothetical protein
VQPGKVDNTHALQVAKSNKRCEIPCRTSYPFKHVSEKFAAYIVYITIIHTSVKRLSCILGLPSSTLGSSTSSADKLTHLMEQRPS